MCIAHKITEVDDLFQKLWALSEAVGLPETLDQTIDQGFFRARDNWTMTRWPKWRVTNKYGTYEFHSPTEGEARFTIAKRYDRYVPAEGTLLQPALQGT